MAVRTSKRESGGDAGDLELGVRLPVAADAIPALFLRAEVPELAMLAVAHDLGLHPRARDQRLAELHLGPFADQEDVQRHLRADVLRELLHLEEVALLDAVLLSACPDHCVHRILLPFRFDAARQAGGSRRRARKERAI